MLRLFHLPLEWSTLYKYIYRGKKLFTRHSRTRRSSDRTLNMHIDRFHSNVNFDISSVHGCLELVFQQWWHFMTSSNFLFKRETSNVVDIQKFLFFNSFFSQIYRGKDCSGRGFLCKSCLAWMPQIWAGTPFAVFRLLDLKLRLTIIIIGWSLTSSWFS